MWHTSSFPLGSTALRKRSPPLVVLAICSNRKTLKPRACDTNPSDACKTWLLRWGWVGRMMKTKVEDWQQQNTHLNTLDEADEQMLESCIRAWESAGKQDEGKKDALTTSYLNDAFLARQGALAYILAMHGSSGHKSSLFSNLTQIGKSTNSIVWTTNEATWLH